MNRELHSRETRVGTSLSPPPVPRQKCGVIFRLRPLRPTISTTAYSTMNISSSGVGHFPAFLLNLFNKRLRHAYRVKQ